MRKLVGLLVVVVAVLAAAVGCGGGDDGDSAGAGEVTVTTSSLSKAQFVKRAEAACRRATIKMLGQTAGYLKQDSSEGPQISESDGKAMGEALQAMVESESDAIQGLGAPAGDEDQVEAILAAQQEAAEDVADGEIESFGDIGVAFERAAELGSAYGFTVCSNDFAQTGNAATGS